MEPVATPPLAAVSVTDLAADISEPLVSMALLLVEEPAFNVTVPLLATMLPEERIVPLAADVVNDTDLSAVIGLADMILDKAVMVMLPFAELNAAVPIDMSPFAALSVSETGADTPAFSVIPAGDVMLTFSELMLPLPALKTPVPVAVRVTVPPVWVVTRLPFRDRDPFLAVVFRVITLPALRSPQLAMLPAELIVKEPAVPLAEELPRFRTELPKLLTLTEPIELAVRLPVFTFRLMPAVPVVRWTVVACNVPELLILPLPPVLKSMDLLLAVPVLLPSVMLPADEPAVLREKEPISRS